MHASVWMQTNYDTGPRRFISNVEEHLARNIRESLTVELTDILGDSGTTVRVWVD